MTVFHYDRYYIKFVFALLNHFLMFLLSLFDATKSNQKRLDDLNALRLSASFERKIVNMVCFA